ncbi:MAG: transporter substrate-binding domain-containing protein [Bacteroidota bacterium]|jgi:membrane-bound lytic murein transglycosylase F
MIFSDPKNKLALSLIILYGIICIYPFDFSSRIDPNSQNDSLSCVNFDLDEIKKRGKLIVLTENSSTGFYIYKGDSMGFEFELLNSFAKNIGVTLELVIVKDMNAIFNQLNKGEVDIIAANLTVTQERVAIVDFTEPLMLTRQVLIQRKPDNWETLDQTKLNKKLIRNILDLDGKNIDVRKGSSFYTRLVSLSEEIGGKINITEVSGGVDTEELIRRVARGEIDYTVADENIALNNQTYYANIDIETPISFHQQIAWAIRKQSPLLNKELNRWMEKIKKSNESALAYNKYFKSAKKTVNRAENNRFSYRGGSISQYDDMFKLYSEKIGWDWQLLASMVYQESHFKATAQSWAGANGLMQLVPGTARRYGLDSTSQTAEQSIKAGTSYIKDLDKYWKHRISYKEERIKFILASYNVGLGHVIDARNLASKYGKDPNLWFHNVEYMVLQKSNPMIYNDPIVKCGYCRGQETFMYVKEILNRYENYKNVQQNNVSFVRN